MMIITIITMIIIIVYNFVLRLQVLHRDLSEAMAASRLESQREEERREEVRLLEVEREVDRRREVRREWEFIGAVLSLILPSLLSPYVRRCVHT